MKSYFHKLAIVLVVISGCKKPKSDDPTPINPLSLAASKSPYATLADYFKKAVTKQLFTLPNNTANVRLKCNQGTILELYRASLLDVNNVPVVVNTDVRIEIEEYISAKDMLLYGKNTNATDTLLASQGLINIKLKDGNGNTLHFASTANALKVEFPAKTYTFTNSDFYLGATDANNLLNSTLQPNGRNKFTKQTDAIEGAMFYMYSLPHLTNWVQCAYPKPATVGGSVAVTVSFDEPKLIGKQKLVYAYSEILNAAYVSVTTNNEVTLNRLPQGYNFKLVCLSIVNEYMYTDVQNWNSTATQQLSPRSITDAEYSVKIRAL
ncbi:MAG: hypothetical protein H7331_00090 [Bacteroidia bacterium]|nr:hypothetical protein [Bacteroidia bacterium]